MVVVLVQTVMLGDREVVRYWGNNDRAAYLWYENRCWKVLWEDEWNDPFPTEYDSHREAEYVITNWINGED